jgi:hypothetical protein
MWRFFITLVLLLHGLIHLLGLVVYLKIATPEGLPDPTALLGGHLAATSTLVR